MEMETEVAVTAGELSLHPDIIDGVELPSRMWRSTSTLVTAPTMTPMTTPVMTPTTTDNWLVIYTHLCVK